MIDYRLVGDSELLHQGLQSFFQGSVIDVFHIGFVVNGNEVDGIARDLDMGNDSGAAGLTLALGGDGKAYFSAVTTDVGSDKGIVFQFSKQGCQVIFEGSVPFSQGF